MPLTFDMPREQLASYTGTNPCPSDFSELWENGFAEMAELDPSIELVPAQFQTSSAECFHLASEELASMPNCCAPGTRRIPTPPSSCFTVMPEIPATGSASCPTSLKAIR